MQKTLIYIYEERGKWQLTSVGAVGAYANRRENPGRKEMAVEEDMLRMPGVVGDAPVLLVTQELEEEGAIVRGPAALPGENP
ncbi:hypothetical protein D1007_59511 [Hordeum vulgare]|nr:hypothetical protein D1007_59511 [Hordeum vulgare]